jgi:hypothetical protein
VKHIRNGQFLQENGPLWFCLALLIFSLAFVAMQALRPGFKSHVEAEGPPNTGKLVGFAIAMAALTFVVRLVLPPGASFLNMHLGDFPQYILLFGAGVVAARGEWLLKLSFLTGVRWLMVVLPAGFAAWLMILRAGPYFGGWHWQAACLNLWESFTCVAMCFSLLVIFREILNGQGRLAKFLSDNAFSVYVFHPPIVILAARILHGCLWPPILKFIILTAIGAVVTFALSAALFRRIPILRNIL